MNPISSSSPSTGQCSESHPSDPKVEQIRVTNWFRFELGSLWIFSSFLAHSWGLVSQRWRQDPSQAILQRITLISPSSGSGLWTGTYMNRTVRFITKQQAAGHRKKKKKEKLERSQELENQWLSHKPAVFTWAAHGIIQRQLGWPLCKDDTATRETSCIFSGVMKKFWRWIAVNGCTMMRMHLMPENCALKMVKR